MSPTPPTKQSTDTDFLDLHAPTTLSFDSPPAGTSQRPPVVKYMSTPPYQSPLRHHKRAASSNRQVKETLNARSQYSNSEDDGTAEHRINQYLIKHEIGRGSFGAVHLAEDQYGQEYAIKEFSKSRLRKRAQSNLLRRPSRRRPGGLASGRLGFNSPLHRHSGSEENNSLDLIKEEIAIMKKLNHPNLVSLIEVLDDPEEDSLYMVMEMCKKGVVMRVGLDERADPYQDEQCRCWFRDMILGIEYLHAQGIIHRDLKPDNCLVTDDDVLKIVDFGVSEMFEKETEMLTTKSAGSPAFMPPELCVPKHGAVDGRAADIWSMGVTLYCLRFGRIPFEKLGMLELFDSIRNDVPDFEDCDPDLQHLLLGLLAKDPEQRLKMEQIRVHPWVTRHGTDPLLSVEENVAVIVDPPTEEEVNAAITGNMGHLVTVVRAVKRFKQLIFRKRPELQGFLGSASRMVQPPMSMRPSSLRKTKSADTDNRHVVEGALATEGVHRDFDVSRNNQLNHDDVKELVNTQPTFRGLDGNTESKEKPCENKLPGPQPVVVMEPKVIHSNMSSRPVSITAPIPIPTPRSRSRDSPSPAAPLGKGHAHDPSKDILFLHIGSGALPDHESTPCPSSSDVPLIVSESPSNADMDVYERAYQEEVHRIIQTKRDRRPTLYLTRRVEGVKSLRENEFIFDAMRDAGTRAKSGIADLVGRARGGFEHDCGVEKEKEKGDGGAVGGGESGHSAKEGILGMGLKGMRDLKDAVNDAKEKRGADGDADARTTPSHAVQAEKRKPDGELDGV